MRAFVAIDVDDPGTVCSLVKLQSKLEIDARPVPPANLHVTLQFLGEIGPPGVVAGALRRISFDPFDMEVRGVGAFPESGPPRVVWVGAGGSISGLAEKVQEVLAPLGLRRDGPFAPHLTIFRVKKKAVDVRAKLDGMDNTYLGTQRVSRIKLKASADGSYTNLWESGA